MRVKSVPDVKFCLLFRCERLSVPVMRRVLGDTLRGLGADEESVHDLLLAATETPIAELPESGRGLAVMRACVDNVTLDTSPGRGTVVTLRKHIRWSQDAPIRHYR